MSEETKRFLTAEEILGADDLKPREVEVPEWGGSVLMRPMTGEEAISLVGEGVNRGQVAFRVVSMTLVREDGSRLFTDEQLEALKLRSAAALLRLQKKAMELNQLTDEGAAQAKNS